MNTQDVLAFLGSELFAFVASSVLLALYHLYLLIKLKANPLYTVQAVNTIARTAWVDQILQKREVITGVQTLRNSTMAATFLASTAVLLIVGVLTLSEQGDKLSSTWHNLNIWGTVTPTVWTLKLLAILVDLFVAFFAFSMSIRTYNHVGFMLYVPAHMTHTIITREYVTDVLNRAGRFYSVGMRAYYFLVPLVFWLFGGIYMVMTTIALVFALYRLDRAPAALAAK